MTEGIAALFCMGCGQPLARFGCRVTFDQAANAQRVRCMAPPELRRRAIVQPGGRNAAETLTREIASILGGIVPPGCSYIFMIANHGDGGGPDEWMTYAASIARGDAVKLLRELASKLEAGTLQ